MTNLMRKIVDKYPKSVKFAARRQSVVRTKSNDTLTGLFHQRIRWAGKWRHQTHLVPRALAIFIFGFHVVTTLFIPLVLLDLISLWLAVVLLSAKILGELIFFSFVSPFLQVTWQWGAFVILQFLYSPYVILIALLSNFQGYKWKGRKLKALTISSN